MRKTLTRALTLVAAAALLPLAALADDRGSDGVAMQGGHMVVRADGTTAAMTQDVVLQDGSRVLRNGTVLRPDGATVVMHDGDAISKDGTFMVRDGIQFQR